MTPQPAGRTAAAERDQFIDVVRVAAVLAVVFGHWITTSVSGDLARAEGENALSVIPWFRVATWVLQVMPVLFFVGGFSNSRALERRNHDYLHYLRERLTRLMRPAVGLFAVWLAIGVVIEFAEPAAGNFLLEAAAVAALPMWFLGIYILVVALAPAMLRLHIRWRWKVPAALAAGAAAVDVLHIGLDVPEIGVANYAFVWLLAHQLGYFYADGTLARIPVSRRWALAGAGIAALVILTTVVEYPASLVGVPGQERWNTDPPALPLVAGTVWLVGLVLALRPFIARRRRIGKLAARLNPRVLTVYVWHVSALPIAVAILFPLGFPRPDTGTLRWWLWRPVWMAVLAAALAGLVFVFRGLESHPQKPSVPRREPSATARLTVAGVAAFSLAVAVLGFGRAGFDDLGGSGSSLLSFTVDPLQSSVLLGVGLAALAATRLRGRRLRSAGALAAGVYIGMGAAAAASEGFLGMNRATGVLLIVAGGLATALLAASHIRTRSDPGS